jgi:hypothetical protein
MPEVKKEGFSRPNVPFGTGGKLNSFFTSQGPSFFYLLISFFIFSLWYFPIKNRDKL